MGFLDRLFSGPPSKDSFARMLMDGIRGAGETGGIDYDEGEFRLVSQEGPMLFLGNAYHEYCSRLQGRHQRRHALGRVVVTSQ